MGKVLLSGSLGSGLMLDAGLTQKERRRVAFLLGLSFAKGVTSLVRAELAFFD